jgi:hypothetical protein
LPRITQLGRWGVKDWTKVNNNKLGVVAHTCNPSYSGEGGGGKRISSSRPALAKVALRPSQK